MTTISSQRISAARLAPALAFLSVAFWFSSAHAAPEGANQRVVLRAFRGPQAARVKDAVESALLLRYSLVPDSMVTDAARRSGGRLLTDQDFAAVAKTLNVHAFVSATVRKQQDWKVEMVVRKGDTGQAVAKYDWSGRHIDALAASVARRTPSRLKVLLAGKPDLQAQAPAVDEVVQARAEAQEQPASDGAPVDGVSRARQRPFLEIGVGSRVFSRSMTYAQNVSGRPGYRLDGGTGVAAEIALHPFGASDATANTWAEGIGLYGAVNLSFGIGTQVDATGAPSKTDAHGYEAGLRYRIAAGVFDVIPHGSYLVDSFVTGSDWSPNVTYHVLRAGLGTRAALSSHFSLRASVDYLSVLSAGAFTSTAFPRASANGVDVSLGAGYGIGKTFEIQAAGALRRYGFDMRSRPGDTNIAGGASDQYLSMVVGIAYRPSLGRH
ncbi:MAG TPA: hypothetical protein VFH68_10085 [Polyangia bacterium]|nr:hypothetical protein [Polyangia bacterium]